MAEEVWRLESHARARACMKPFTRSLLGKKCSGFHKLNCTKYLSNMQNNV